MLKITPDPPHLSAEAFNDDLLQDHATRTRVLNHYLGPRPASAKLNLEDALVHASSVLRSANATALEASRGCSDAQRDLVFAVLHLVDMARELVDQSLNNLPAR
ncbi:MAG: DUF3077 domain-containing protein [Pseudomonadota bacterium]